VIQATDALGAMVVAVLDNQAAVLGILRYPSPSSMAYVKILMVVVEAMVKAVQGFLAAVMDMES
jgi:hypothetical protein